MHGTRSNLQKTDYDLFQEAFQIITDGGSWMDAERATGLNRQRIQRLYKKTYPGLKEGGTVSKEAGVLDTTEETKTGSTSSADTMTLDWIRRCSSDDPTIFPTVEEKVQFAEKLIDEEGQSVRYAAIVVGIDRTTLRRSVSYICVTSNHTV